MTLIEYLTIDGNQASLAAALSKSPAQIWQWKEGIRPVPTDLCAAIEKATDHQVTRKDLRPDDYWLIWPDLPAPPTPTAIGEGLRGFTTRVWTHPSEWGKSSEIEKIG